MANDIFTAVRERVTARSCAEFYGHHPNTAGFICCPFHGEKTPSLKFYDDGHFYCFGCHAGGDATTFTEMLFGLTPLEAAKKLNDDFHLGLSIGGPQTPQQRREAQREAQEREKVHSSWELFSAWKEGLNRQLYAVCRTANNALSGIETIADMDRLTPEECEAIQRIAWTEDILEALANGTMEKQMEIFRTREEVETICSRILSNTPRKSKTV